MQPLAHGGSGNCKTSVFMPGHVRLMSCLAFKKYAGKRDPSDWSTLCDTDTSAASFFFTLMISCIFPFVAFQ